MALSRFVFEILTILTFFRLKDIFTTSSNADRWVRLLAWCFLSEFYINHSSKTGHFWATVTSNGSSYAIGPLSRLSVTLVYCGQTVGWIKTPLGLEVGLGPGGIVLDGDPAPPRKGAEQSPLFGPL